MLIGRGINNVIFEFFLIYMQLHVAELIVIMSQCNNRVQYS